MKLLRNQNFILPALGCIAILLAFICSGEPVIPVLQNTKFEKVLINLGWQNAIVFNLAIGYLVSSVFWVLVVYLPERKRRKVLKNNLNLRYKWFKQAILQNFSWAGNENLTTEELSDLLNYKKFNQSYRDENQQKWYNVLNGLGEKRNLMSNLILELDIFANELNYVLNNLSIDDEKIHYVFRQFKEVIYRFKNSADYSEDQPKYVGNFLWGIFSRFDIIDGQRDYDYVQEAIDLL